MVATIALVAAVSCNKEFEQENIPAGGQTVVYTATVDQTEVEPDAKATLNQTTKKSEWVKDDAITVHDGTNSWTFTAAEAGENVEFSNSEGFGAYRPVIAVYPAEYTKDEIEYTYTVDVAQRTVNAYIPTYQGVMPDTYNDKAALAVAYSENDEFAFKNAHSLIKFRIIGSNIKAIEFYGNNDEPITGNMLVSLNENNTINSVVGQDTDFKEEENKWTGKGTWVKCYSADEANNWCFKDGQTYYAAIAPANFTGGVSLNVVLNDDTKVEKIMTTTKPYNLLPSKILNIGDVKYEAPVVHEWAIAGTFNGWNTTANPMTKEGDYYVARGVTGLNFGTPEEGKEESSTGFKFVVNGTDWKGSAGEAVSGTWAYVYNTNDGNNIYVKNATAEAAYDIYVNPSEGDNGKFVIVPTGQTMPEDKPVEEEVEVGYWAVVGSMTDSWNSEKKMTLDGDWYVVEGVEIRETDQFKFRADENWDVDRGAEGEVHGVVINGETTAIQGGKNFAVGADGVYSLYINKSATKVKAEKTADLPEISIPDQPSDWALWAETGVEWEQLDMVTTTVPTLFVRKNVTLEEYKSFLIKAATHWNTKYGVGGVNYINPDHCFTAVSQGDNITVDAGGTFDIYFDSSSKKVYLMTTGTTYTSAIEQTVSGDGPSSEPAGVPVEPNHIYLKPDGGWSDAGARFGAYFFGGEGQQWTELAAVDGTEGYYECQKLGTHTSVIFCRYNPDSSGVGWGSDLGGDFWGQTVNLELGQGNLFTVSGWENGKGVGAWSTVDTL